MYIGAHRGVLSIPNLIEYVRRRKHSPGWLTFEKYSKLASPINELYMCL